MKIKNYKIGAVIPTVQYGNLQPVIELEGEDLEEMQEVGLNHIKDLHHRFSDKDLNETVKSIQDGIKIKSWNENVELDRDGDHKYTYQDKKFVSGSVFASSFYPKFDAQGIAKNCEKSWGVDADDIVDMWGSNGSVSSDFGTAVHKALEHYFTHRGTANTIMETKDDSEDKAMPKHPILRKIIEDFIKMDKSKGDIECEVLVTDVNNLRCGIIDRLLITDQDKKICRVQDYKINVGAEDESSNMKAKAPYNELPKNKLTKYQIQLSFYAEILKNSGWTVEGLDIYVLEDEWKHYPMELLTIN